jgi:hypothetical protein
MKSNVTFNNIYNLRISALPEHLIINVLTFVGAGVGLFLRRIKNN